MSAAAATMSDEAHIDTVVIGLGATGWSCARYLWRQGIGFAVTDSRDQPPHQTSLAAECPGVPVATGRFDRQMIKAAKHLIISPGVSLNEPEIEEAIAAGAEVIGDIELFARRAQAPLVAITGSNGKSTVTTLFTEMARNSGLDVRCGGNLGTPALDLLGPHLLDDSEPDLYVLELSSFQLETTSSLTPAVATVLNVMPDHQDRYPDLEHYAAAKRRIYGGEGAIVINADDPWAASMVSAGRRILRFTLQEPGMGDFGLRNHRGAPWLMRGRESLLPASELGLSGRHNIANALAALALGTAMDLPVAAMLTALCQFKGLPHRCQWVGSMDGIDWYNDSKGTNVGATCAAIKGLAVERSLVLIAGGIAKGADFRELAEAAAGRVKALVALGEDATALMAALDQVPGEYVQDMGEAVARAQSLAASGDAVLLSPACASFDMFRDYQERGQAYMDEVKRQVLGQ